MAAATYKMAQSALNALERTYWGSPRRLCRALLLVVLGRGPVEGIEINEVIQRTNTTRLQFTVTGQRAVGGFRARVYKYRGSWRVMVSRVLPFHICGSGASETCHVCIMAGLA